MKKITLLIGLLLLSVVGLADRDKSLGLHSDGGMWDFYPTKRFDEKLPNVLLIGDSIMNGYRKLVTKEFTGKVNVDCWLTPAHLKSAHLHKDLKKVINYRKYDVIHFNIGLHGWPVGRILPEEYSKVLQDYVDILKKESPKSKLIWASMTQVHTRGNQTLNKDINPTIVRRNEKANKLMKKNGVVVNDLYLLLSDKLELVRGDRFHWKGPAYKLMTANICYYINAALNK